MRARTLWEAAAWFVVFGMTVCVALWFVNAGDARRLQYAVAAGYWWLLGVPAWLSFLAYSAITRRKARSLQRWRAAFIAIVVVLVFLWYISIEWPAWP
jgi:hypothetical protein